jgi:hypothetical protein
MVSCFGIIFSFTFFMTCGLSIVYTCSTKLLIIMLVSFVASPSLTSFTKSQFENVLKFKSHIQKLETLNLYELWIFTHSQKQKLHSNILLQFTTTIIREAHNNKINHQSNQKDYYIFNMLFTYVGWITCNIDRNNIKQKRTNLKVQSLRFKDLYNT